MSRLSWRLCVMGGAGAVVVVMAGCQSGAPAHGTEEKIAEAAAVSDAVVFSVEGGALDEAGGAEGTLALTDALRRALRTDAGLQAALARVRIAAADAEQARLWPNPILSVVFRFPENSGKPFIEASLAADLLTILQTPGRTRAADARLRASAEEAVVVALDVIEEVQGAYAAAQALERERPLVEERRGIVEKLRGLAQKRLDAGEGVRSDVTVLEAQRVGLEVEAAEVERQRRDVRLRLVRMIGTPSGDAEWKLDAWAASAGAGDESTWVRAALEKRPEIQARVWELAATGEDVRLAKWAVWQGSDVSLNVQRNDVWEVGPGASAPVPLFDMGQAKTAKATAQQIEARHQLTQTRRRVIEEVRRAHASLSAAEKNQQRVEKELMPLQERRRSEAEARFLAGETDSTEVFLAEQELKGARSRLIELQRDAADAAVRLERAVGGPAAAAGVRTVAGEQMGGRK